MSHSFSLQNSEIYSNDGLELKDGEVLAKENGDAIADKIQSEDKKAEKEKSKEEKAKKMDVDKKIQEVESASGEKVVRAAHVPVPSQVGFGLPYFVNPSYLGRRQSSYVTEEKTGTFTNFCCRNSIRTIPRSKNFTRSLVAWA